MAASKARFISCDPGKAQRRAQKGSSFQCHTCYKKLRNPIGDYQVCESLTRCDHAYQSVKLETQRLLKISSEIHRYLPQLQDEATVLAYRGHGTVEDIESDASGDDQPCSEEEDTQDEQTKEFAHPNTTRLTDEGAPRPFLCPCSPCERSFKTSHTVL